MSSIIFFGILAFVIWLWWKTSQTKPGNPHITAKASATDLFGREDDAEPELGQDNWERFNFYGAGLVPAKGRYHIAYTDQRGLATERDIDIKRVYEDNGKFAIGALCHLRDSHRNFLDERIKSAVDLNSGEIVASVAKHAIAQYQDSGAGVAWKAIGREWMAAQLLGFVCRSDGQMRKAERVIVADYLKRRCTDLPQNIDEALDDAIKTVGGSDPREFKRIINDMKTAGDIDKLRDILDCAKRIVATQKTIDPMEKAAIELLEKAVA